jgi:hypothetical protein
VFTARYELVLKINFRLLVSFRGPIFLPIFFCAIRKRVYFATARQLVPFAKLRDQYLYDSLSITDEM